MLNALVPVFCVILLGHLLKRLNFPGREFWPQAERITYYLLFPSLLIGKLARADFGSVEALPMGLALGLALVAAGGLLLALRPMLKFDGPAFSSVFQGGTRMNTYVGLAGAAALYGDVALTPAAVAMTVMIPIINVMCVPVVARLGGSTNGRGFGLVMELAKNPLILGCIIGFALNASGLPLHESVFETLTVVGRAALPLGLLAVGSGLRFRSLGPGLGAVAVSSLVKLLVLPLCTAALCLLFGADGLSLSVAVLFAALPTASSSYILARQLGGDAELMATILTLQTMLSIATLPAILWLVS